jgi:hypothetical protein
LKSRELEIVLYNPDWPADFAAEANQRDSLDRFPSELVSFEAIAHKLKISV